MIRKEKLEEIREHLERAQNPAFFFDNDLDGLCSYLLLRRFLERGRGVAIKSFPELDESYFRKVNEFDADYIFILDKPLVSEEFFERCKEKNIPIVWLDHHEVDQKIPEFVNYYNTSIKGEGEPVTDLCYSVSRKKSDLWIAVMGCISDKYLPPYYDEFLKEYPELGIDADDAFKVLYESRVGEMVGLLSAGLKDKTTNVVNMMKYLVEARGPYDVLEENSKNKGFHLRSQQIGKKYNILLKKARSVAKASGKILFFRYAGDLSVSGELANHLKFLYPDKYVVVVYEKGARANLSLRGSKVRDAFLKAIEGIEGASGGGHEDAVGGQMQSEDLDKFRTRLEEELD